MALARFHCVPLPCIVLESSLPFSQVGAMLGMPRSVLPLDESEAPPREEAERLAAVAHRSTVGRGSECASLHVVGFEVSRGIHQ
jgi:hypothetical protein